MSPTGVLEKFERDSENTYTIRPTPECRALFELRIPEGVRVLPGNVFREYTIHNKLIFPDSLQVLGEGKSGAFPHCELGEVTLPKSAEIGPNTFSGSRIIDTVKIPDGADHQMTVKLAHALRFTFSFLMLRQRPGHRNMRISATAKVSPRTVRNVSQTAAAAFSLTLTAC